MQGEGGGTADSAPPTAHFSSLPLQNESDNGQPVISIDRWAFRAARGRRLLETGCVLLTIVGLPAARARATVADDLCNPNDNPCVVMTPVVVTDGSVIDVGSRTLEIANLASLSVGSGTMTLKAGQLVVDVGGSLLARNPDDTGGTIMVTAGTVNIAGNGGPTPGTVDASGDEAGLIDFEATGAITIDGMVFADALQPDGSGNEVDLRGATVTVGPTGTVRSNGLREGCGGDITIDAFGDVNVSGIVEGSGGEGGTATITAGAMQMSGNINVAVSGRINSVGNIAAACGGTITLEANGDGINTGNIVMDGQINASAPNGNLEDGGGSGGAIDLTGTGSISSTMAAARLIAVGSGPDGEGGTVDILAQNGTLTVPGRSDVGSPGIDSGGGCYTATAHGDVNVSGIIDGTAGSNTAGEVVLTSNTGNIDIAASSLIDVSGTTGGDAGVITLKTLAADGPAAVAIEGQLRANGGAISGTNAGFAGLIDITAGDAGTIASGARLEAMTRGPVSNVETGTGVIMLAVGRGPASIDGTVTAAGLGIGAPGGSISLSADSMVGTGTVDASGQGAQGGKVSVETSGRVNWGGQILATASGQFPGGMVEVVTEDGNFNLRGTIRTDGASSAFPTDINIVACDLILENNGVISSTQTDGENVLTGRQGTAVFGTLKAGARNVIRFNLDPPVIFASAVVMPTPVEQQDSSIQPCTVPPTPTPSMCVGDCDHDGKVSVDELIRGIYIALDILPLSDCEAFDRGGDGVVTIDDLVQAIDGSINGCV